MRVQSELVGWFVGWLVGWLVVFEHIFSTSESEN
jgi:hypothetical protein